MTNTYNLLKEEINKRIYACKNCGGSGYDKTQDLTGHKTKNGRIYDYCSSCQGKGYVIPLEVGCEVEIVHEEEENKIITMSEPSSIKIKEEWCSESRSMKKLEYLSDDYPGCGCGAFSKDIKNFINLGKPLTHADIFRCIKSGVEMETDRTRIIIHGDNGIIEMPLTDPQDWDESTHKSLLELIK